MKNEEKCSKFWWRKSTVQKIKRSKLLWKYSGLTYKWSVMATRGRYLSLDEYIENSMAKINSLGINFNGVDVLEFGCGIGGNLMAISKQIRTGVGLDINRLYIWRANHLCRKLEFKNLTFIQYDGISIPNRWSFDVIFSLNVLERISQSLTIEYVHQLKDLGRPNCIMSLFFLAETAKITGFINRLGEDAYTFWSANQIKDVLNKCDFSDWKVHIDEIPIMPGETNNNGYLLTLIKGKN
jgi:SAM-dependent methyltransferase